MAKTPETVESFLEELAVKLQPLWAKEREVMLKLKVRYTIKTITILQLMTIFTVNKMKIDSKNVFKFESVITFGHLIYLPDS